MDGEGKGDDKRDKGNERCEVLVGIERLLAHQFSVDAVQSKQLPVGALFHYAAVFDDTDKVSILDRGQTMSNGNGSTASFTDDIVDGFLNQFLGFTVERRCGFIQ